MPEAVQHTNIKNSVILNYDPCGFEVMYILAGYITFISCMQINKVMNGNWAVQLSTEFL